MTLPPEIEALVQGALDDTLTPEERERLDRLMAGNLEVRGRLTHLQTLVGLLDSLGPAEPPAELVPEVLARISGVSQSPVDSSPERIGRVEAFQARTAAVRSHVVRKDFAVGKKIMFGLAAAAVLVLGVMTFMGYPPAMDGTQATIGVAERAETPAIDAKDVVGSDTSAQAVLQADTWDAIVRDDSLRTLLQDANVRAQLQDPELQRALSDDEILKALRDPMLGRRLQEMMLSDANLPMALRNPAFLRALRNDHFRQVLARADMAAALTRPAFQTALRDRNFTTALGQSRGW